MALDEDLIIEKSPLSGLLTRDGGTVDVQIYRIAGTGEGWTLEVINRAQTSTIWDDAFSTDDAAYTELCRALESDGIGSFSDRPQ